MRIGIDFDNTIANYDGVFYATALERGLIPADLPTGKNAVRDFLNGSDRKDEFTELQGYIYGARMELVSLYHGVDLFFLEAARRGDELFVVSHKTRHPMLGPKHDLHAAARDFLKRQGLAGDAPYHISDDRVFFKLSKGEKVASATVLDLDVFIDDLPEILAMPDFPDTLRRILFDPDGSHPAGVPGHPDVARCRSWAEVSTAVWDPPR